MIVSLKNQQAASDYAHFIDDIIIGMQSDKNSEEYKNGEMKAKLLTGTAIGMYLEILDNVQTQTKALDSIAYSFQRIASVMEYQSQMGKKIL